jgi:hypothetical protein
MGRPQDGAPRKGPGFLGLQWPCVRVTLLEQSAVLSVGLAREAVSARTRGSTGRRVGAALSTMCLLRSVQVAPETGEMASAALGGFTHHSTVAPGHPRLPHSKEFPGQVK